MASSNAKVIRTVSRGAGKGTPVRSFKEFLPSSVEAVIRGKAVQLRVLAEGSADLLVERVFAGDNSGLSVAKKPSKKSKGEGVGESKAPLDLEPLSKRYADDKRNQGLDGRILLARGDYINNIEVVRNETQDGGITYRVRLVPGRHPSGFTFRVLGRILEFGSLKTSLPPRPHWRPVGEQAFRAFNRLRTQASADEIRDALRRMR